jgi:Ferredoxin-like domain in Api92-like protein
MPNYVTNELKAAPHVLAALKGDDLLVDFNVIIPRPACFKDEPMHLVIDWARLAMGLDKLQELQDAAMAAGNPADSFKAGKYGDATKVLHYNNVIRMMLEGPFPKDFTDADFEHFLNCCRCIKETGYAYWLDWCVEKWGTKWNSGDAEQIDANTIRFDTAWSPPIPVIVELAKRFPSEAIRLRWADEDFGYNTGDVTFTGDSFEGGKLPNDSHESHTLAMELKYDGKCPDHMAPTESGKYAYVGE